APPTIDILVAARDIPRGKLITADDLTIMSWPAIEQAPPPLGVLVVDGSTGAGLEQAVGRMARADILAGSPVLETVLTAAGQATDLADVGSDAALRIPSGYIAIAVPVTRLSSVAYALREGDHVDVLMSFRFMDVDEEFQTELPNNAVLLDVDEETGELVVREYPVGREERGIFGDTIMMVPGDGEKAIQQTTQLVIDNAVVLHVGNWPLSDLNQPIVVTPEPTPTPVPEGEAPADGQTASAQTAPTPVPSLPVPDVVTLIMPRQDALIMKYAIEQGASIDLALRSAADDDVQGITTDPVTLSYIINSRNVTPPEKLPIALDPRLDKLQELVEEDIYVAPPPPQETGVGS
ncbi:MAG TPA: Flp pilus assembly protein CpaB, partial [Aggregatilineales bacterium]|nr:Flp pilus assembly protein CpaB [Aggregatilineales bacterium]